MTRSGSRRCVRRKVLSSLISGLFSGRPREDARPRRGSRPPLQCHVDFTRLAASRSDLIIQAHFKLVLLDGRTLLMRIPCRSLTPSSACEKNVYVYSQNADELGRFSKRALSQYLQAQFSNSLRI